MYMHREKSIARHEYMIAASSSSSDDENNVSLDADQEEASTSTHDAALPVLFHNVEAVFFYSGIHSPSSTRCIGRITFQCKFVLL